MNKVQRMDQLLAVLDNKISQERAEQLLAEADGSLDAAVAIYFSTAQQDAGNSESSSSSQLQQLAAILGPQVTNPRLRRLLSRAGTVPRAADLYFSEAGPGTEAAASAGPSQPESPLQASPITRPRRHRRPTAAAQSPVLTLDSDEEESDAAPDEPPAHGPMQTASSADLFQGFISALQPTRGHASGHRSAEQQEEGSDDSDGDFTDDGNSDGPGPSSGPAPGSGPGPGPGRLVTFRQLFGLDDENDEEDGTDEAHEQHDPEDEAGPSSSSPAGGFPTDGQQHR